MTFRIYDQTERRLTRRSSPKNTPCNVRNGHFSVLLGNIYRCPALLRPDTFIGVTVDPFDEKCRRASVWPAPLPIA